DVAGCAGQDLEALACRKADEDLVSHVAPQRAGRMPQPAVTLVHVGLAAPRLLRLFDPVTREG
ncbi:MAG: hypothetical protein M3252_02215, partial [Actinomycetota bacterium]|nr:hypothetical protein [Actinomycetota bacterium]